MKKLYLFFLALLLLFIPTTHAIAVYQLDQPVSRLNGYTLREVFQNRNIAIPDLSTATNLGGGNYRIFNNNGVTVDYNVNSGIRTINGIWTSATGTAIIPLLNVNGLTLTVSVQIVSGVLPAGTYYRPSGLVTYQLGEFEGIAYQVPYTRNDDFIRITNGAVFNNFQYKLQLEKGSIATPYQVPTTGPYSDVDISLFGLTNEEIQTYYDLYLEAVRFEIENYEAGQDPGGYESIFKSIINGVKGLINQMADVWQWLNAPLIQEEAENFGFTVDWSWDIVNVIRQIILGLRDLVLGVIVSLPRLLFNLLGIPVHISILSIIFSNFVFVLLGWIMVKSFII